MESESHKEETKKSEPSEQTSSEKTSTRKRSSCLHPSRKSKVVLIAIDPSEKAEQAFYWFLDTLYKPEQEIICMHVIEPPDVRHDLYSVQAGLYQQAINAASEKVKALGMKYEETLKNRNISGTISMRMSSRPGEALVEAAEEFKADFVVMGTRGLGRIRRTILGSVSDYLVHHAHCPVIICRQ